MDVQQLYRSLAQADAAGDTQAAQTLADYIRTLPGAPPPPPPTKQGGSDLMTAFKSGAVGSAKALTDVAGADNAASRALGEMSEDIQQQYSPARKAEMQMQAERMGQAEKSGSIWEEIKAGAKSIAEAPLQSMAQGVGSLTPYIPTMILGPIAGAVGLGARAVAAASAVANVAPKVLATAQGVGAVKGSIYDAVYKAELEDGMPEAAAKAKALAAQEYAGRNLDQMALAGVIGYVSGTKGVERLLTPAGKAEAATGLGKRIAKAGTEEFLTEAPQGGQERMASNIALQRTGRDVPTFEGVAGQATQEGLTGALTAGPVSMVRGPGATPVAPEPTITPDTTQPSALPVTELPVPALISTQQELRKLVEAGDTSVGVRDKLAEVTQELQTRGVADTTARAEAITAEREAARREAETEQEAAATEAFQANTENMEQVGFRGMEPEGVITGPAPVRTMEPDVGLADVISDAGLQGTTQDLETAGITPPTTQELEAAGQLPLGLRRTPEGKPTSPVRPTPPVAEVTPEAPPGTFTAKDLADINVPMRTAKTWLTQNVVGKTQEQVQALVDKDPTLVQGKDPRAKILQTLLRPDVPAFKEAENVLPNAPEPVVRPRGRKPSVGIPSQPTGNERGAGLVPRVEPTGKPVQAKPVGLEPVRDDVGARNELKRQRPAAVASPFAQLVSPTAPDLVEDTVVSAPQATVTSPFNWRGPSLTGTTAVDEEAPATARKRGKSSIGISTGRTAGELAAELAQDTSRAGRAVQRLIKSGKLKLADKSPTANEAGNFDGRVATLYADAINEGTAMSVLLHEVGDHMGLEAMLGAANYKSLPGRIKAMAASGTASIERTLARKALARVPEGTPTDSELSAYFIEEIARAAVDGTIPKSGPVSNLWRQVKAAFVSAVNRALGTSFGLDDISVRDMLAMAEAVAIRESSTGPTAAAEPTSKSSISAASKAITAKQTAKIPSKDAPSKTATEVRTMITDSMASIAEKLNRKFQGAVRSGTTLNPLAAMRQAADTSKFVAQFMLEGGFRKDRTTGLYEVFKDPNIKPGADVFVTLDKLAKAEGMDIEVAQRHASVVLEGVRLAAMRESNKTMGTDFKLHMSDSDIDTQVATYNNTPLLQEMSRLMDAPRIQLVNLMEKVGRLTPEAAKAWREVVGYVPFDREQGVSESFTRLKKPSGRGIGQYGKIPELKGSFERPVSDVFDNYVGTIAWMLRQVTITDATRTALEELSTMNIGFKKLPGDSTTAKNASTSKIIQEVWEKGEPAYYELPTKYDKMAFADPLPPPTGMVKIASKVSNVLRTSVTALPPFAVKQVVDDVQRAVFNSGVKNPAALVGKSLSNFFGIVTSELGGKQHPLVAKFAAKGITGEIDSNHQDASKYLMETMGVKKRSVVSGLMHRLDAITRASDLAVRAAVHEQTLTETGDMLLADTRARELINFRRRGSAQGVSTMIATIPFFNAYLQGTDLVYRNAVGTDSSLGVSKSEARKMFATRASQVFAFSLAYAFMMQDDEDYKKMNLRTRNNNWVIGDGIKIPVPSEIAALFKVTAENLVEYSNRYGTPEELKAQDAVINAMANIFEQYAGRVTPIPQVIKPLLEAATNHSFFTGRALEGAHQSALARNLRKTGNTSSFAVAIADFTAAVTDDKVTVSPIMIDNALDGYLGSSSALVKLLTDGIINPNRPDKPIEKWAMLSNFMYETGATAGTRPMDEFYELNAKTSQAAATMNKLAETDVDAAIKYAEKNAGEISLNKSIQRTIQSLGKMRAAVTFLESENGVAAEPDKAVRAEMIKELKAAQRESVTWIREVKQLMNL